MFILKQFEWIGDVYGYVESDFALCLLLLFGFWNVAHECMTQMMSQMILFTLHDSRPVRVQVQLDACSYIDQIIHTSMFTVVESFHMLL